MKIIKLPSEMNELEIDRHCMRNNYRIVKYKPGVFAPERGRMTPHTLIVTEGA